MIIGHSKIIEELKRLSDESRLTHGYLFYGPEGVGKKQIARGFARYLETGEFDNTEVNPILGDFLTVQPNESQTIGIDAIREIKFFLWQAPNKSSRRMVLVDNSECLTGEAQNALLKITEEPPNESLLILIARDPEALQVTLASRLTKIYFSDLSLSIVKQWLIKQVKISEREAEGVAGRSLGRPGIALKLLEDKKFGEYISIAEKISKGSAIDKYMVKEIIEVKDFNFLEFLDALIFVTATEVKKNTKKISFWHRLIYLRREAERFNLNSRIQLENLLLLS